MVVQPDFFVLSWNIRGAANVVFKRHAEEMVKKHNPEICFILANHVQFSHLQNFWLKLGYSSLAVEDVQGQVGEIWALARNDVKSNLSVLVSHHQLISLRVSSGTIY